jgi:glycosyltransferase involved in cell wall biosynthesis
MISVLAPVWDTPGSWLLDMVASVQQQSIPTALVLVNDGSTRTDTLQTLSVLGDNPLIHIVNTEHVGIGHALNRGLEDCTHELVARIDADDLMPPGRLAAQVAIMQADPALTVLSGQMSYMGPDAAPIPDEHPGESTLVYTPQRPVAPQSCIAHPTVMYRRTAVQHVGGYDEEPTRGEDYRLWASLEAAGATFRVRPEVWCRRRVWDGQFSFNRSRFLKRKYARWAASAAKVP